MDDVDGTRPAFDARTAEAVPRLVERQATKRQMSDADRWAPCLLWLMSVLGGHSNELEVVSPGEGARQLQRGDGGSARHAVPALLERHRDAQWPGHGEIVACEGSRPHF